MANELVKSSLAQPYQQGFVTDIESHSIAPGVNERSVRELSALKNEPVWLLEWRLKALSILETMTPPAWAELKMDPVDLSTISVYSAPKKPLASMDEVDPEILKTYEKLGIPLSERAALAGVAVDAVFDSVSVATTFKDRLLKAGVIFCPFSEAVQKYPELVQKYLGTVVPAQDNYYAALNSAVFSDGSFVWIPEGVRCPMELSTYFRINALNTGQFERTLIIAENKARVSYLEGCSSPLRDENQLHAAVVELVAMDHAEIKYSTVQNWYPGNQDGKGGIYNFVTKRAECRGIKSKVSWTQVETGSAITWKYPSVILKGDGSVGEFYSVAVSNGYQQADTGTKMIHVGKNTTSTIVSKGISAAYGKNSYRGLVRMGPSADGAKNHSQCDSLLIGDHCEANTYPTLQNLNGFARIEHEASATRVSEEQLHYMATRGISEQEAVSLVVNGFCKEVVKHLPMEFAVEARKLLEVSLEGAVG